MRFCATRTRALAYMYRLVSTTNALCQPQPSPRRYQNVSHAIVQWVDNVQELYKKAGELPTSRDNTGKNPKQLTQGVDAALCCGIRAHCTCMYHSCTVVMKSTSFCRFTVNTLRSAPPAPTRQLLSQHGNLAQPTLQESPLRRHACSLITTQPSLRSRCKLARDD